MPDTLTFTMPLPDNLANSRLHWAVKHKRKTAFWLMCDMLRKGKVFPKPPKEPWNKAEIAVHMTLGNTMDTDNAVARCKQAIDWLVTRGYVVDDKPKHLIWAGMPTQRVSRKNAPQLDITLTRLEG